MIVFMMIASLITAVIICFTGTIGFIGLVAPHITGWPSAGFRTSFPHPALSAPSSSLPPTASHGASLHQIIPVGIVTAFLGVPFFIYLFLHRRDA